MTTVRRLPELLVPAALVVATALLGLEVSSYLQTYFLDTLVKVAIVVALYVFIGNSGVLSFGHISFVALGAWTAGILTVPESQKQLIMPGLAPLTLPALAATAHTLNLVTGAVTHAYSRWAWAGARFSMAGEPWTGDVDALAVRKGSGAFQRLDRLSVKFPPTVNNRIGVAFTSMCGTLVRVEIERSTGALRIAKAYSVLECGRALVPEVVIGQSQGGFAMGVGYALLETLPPYEGGPGNGQWNLGQYLVARGSDLPLRDLEIEMLPPLTPDEPPKGMAEVVMIPVVPAILNAISDATGRRFQSLPVNQAMLKGALA